MSASSPRAIKTTDLIARPRRKPRTWHNSITNLSSNLMKAEKDLNLARKEVKLSLRLFPLSKSGTTTSHKLMIFPRILSLSLMI
jgi:hypothetical protein